MKVYYVMYEFIDDSYHPQNEKELLGIFGTHKEAFECVEKNKQKLESELDSLEITEYDIRLQESEKVFFLRGERENINSIESPLTTETSNEVNRFLLNFIKITDK